MTIFTMLEISERYIISDVVFLAVIGLLALLIYQYTTPNYLWLKIVNTIVFIGTVVFTAYVMASASEPQAYPLNIAGGWLIVIAVVLVVYSLTTFLSERKRNKNKLSPSSIKETLDNLDSGICFADQSGRIILINIVMGKLASQLIGSYPQTIQEISSALETMNEKSDATKIDGNLFAFSDGKVYRFRTETLQDKELCGFTQMTAQDITEVYQTTEKLKKDNEELHATIQKILGLYDKMSDRIREQETLALKIRVHNESGENLLAISQMLDSGETDKIEVQLQKLQHTLWHFSGMDGMVSATFAEVKERAAAMGISLVLKGETTAIADIEKILVLACHECVTNCAKHAHGKTVTVRVSEHNGFYKIMITNDGEKPGGPIKEGGGLTSLRQTVENIDGEMHISYNPRFALILDLPKEDKQI